MTKHSLPEMRKNKYGRILLLASIAGKMVSKIIENSETGGLSQELVLDQPGKLDISFSSLHRLKLTLCMHLYHEASWHMAVMKPHLAHRWILSCNSYHGYKIILSNLYHWCMIMEIASKPMHCMLFLKVGGI
jgi:hypothetical protein